MKSVINEIRTEIENNGGLTSFSSQIRKNKPIGCPMKRMIAKELQELKKEEIYVAFYLGLIGNKTKQGTIVKDSHKITTELIIHKGVSHFEKIQIELAFQDRHKSNWPHSIERYGRMFANIDEVNTHIQLDTGEKNFSVVYN